jgi:urocanate hydratase
VLRHADAGYSRAIDFAKSRDVEIPMKPRARD